MAEPNARELRRAVQSGQDAVADVIRRLNQAQRRRSPEAIANGVSVAAISFMRAVEDLRAELEALSRSRPGPARRDLVSVLKLIGEAHRAAAALHWTYARIKGGTTSLREEREEIPRAQESFERAQRNLLQGLARLRRQVSELRVVRRRAEIHTHIDRDTG